MSKERTEEDKQTNRRRRSNNEDNKREQKRAKRESQRLGKVVYRYIVAKEYWFVAIVALVILLFQLR